MVSLPQPRLHGHTLLWEVPAGWLAISSAAVGGGIVRPRWVLNADVGGDFVRTDLEDYAAECAAVLGVAGPGCALLTAADVSQVVRAGRDVQAWATVGVTRPTWPVAPRAVAVDGTPGSTDGTPRGDLAANAGAAPAPGTVNIVVAVPVPLAPSALVQAVGTVTEAKAQALVQAGVPGTGTASDAVVVLCPGDNGATTAADTDDGSGQPVPFAGVRSPWGQRVALAVHEAVSAGLAAHPWPADDVDPEAVW